VHDRFEYSGTIFCARVRALLEHNEYRPHHSLAEPLASRHDFGINHNIVVLVRSAGPALMTPARAEPHPYTDDSLVSGPDGDSSASTWS